MTGQASGRRTRRTTRFPGVYAFDCDQHGTVHHEFQYRDGSGRQHWKTVHAVLSTAKRERDAAATEARGIRDSGDRTFRDLVEGYIESRRPFVTHSTAVSYETAWRLVEDALGEVKVTAIDPDKVQRVLLRLLEPDASRPRKRDGYDVTTAHHVRGLLTSVTADARRRRKIAYDPLGAGVIELPTNEPPLRPILTPEQLVRAFDLTEDEPMGRPLLVLGGFLGLRRGEILALTPQDVDGPAPEWLLTSQRPANLHYVMVRQVIERGPKGDRLRGYPKTPRSRRIIPVPTLVVDALLETVTSRSTSEFLLPVPPELKDRGAHLNRDWERVARDLIAAGLPRVTPHEMRHSYATLLAEARVHDFVHKRLMGHTVPGMTGLYSHMTWGQLEAARDEIDAHLAKVTKGTGRVVR